MKRLLFLSVLFSSFLVFTQAQPVRKGAIETATIKVPTVQCDECKDRIEKYISREDGVQKIVVDYKRKTAKVTYLWDRTNIENIKAAIANIGYDADDVTADGQAYAKLPTCCKKPEDGGGHDKK
ncbi:MAG: heavy-metal-associated domain-containing protein [Bacteroidota bacterium]|nr:heavy-metal-associated domain-containing protein [Bacteroidota bacterium]MDP4213167.1 heavy-metal-associated domain-containing protein [Bacteroidota bacterium]MDP4250689.1 heavy-metal-associated domain-containing protein [Bacteroidota bacterium]